MDHSLRCKSSLFVLYHINSSRYLWFAQAPTQMVPLWELEKFEDTWSLYWEIVKIWKSTWSVKVNGTHRFMCLQNPHHMLQLSTVWIQSWSQNLAMSALHLGKPSVCSLALENPRNPFFIYIALFLIKAIHFYTNVCLFTYHEITMIRTPEWLESCLRKYSANGFI